MLPPAGFLSTDHVPPACSLTSPSGTISGVVTVSATATDNDKVANVQFLVDASSIATISSLPYQTSYDTRVLGDGVHTFQAIARDRIGNSTSSSGNATTANNIVRLGAGASHGSVVLGSIPAGSLVFAAAYMPGGSPASVGDNGGNGYTGSNSGAVSGDPADGFSGNVWFYYSVTSAPMTTVTLSGGADQINVVAAAYSKASSLHNNSAITDWGAWGGPSVSAASSREVFLAVTVAGYDGNASVSPNPSVAVSGPFTKLAGQTDSNISWAEIALSEYITTSGGTVTPSGSTNNAADVYGGVCSFTA